jgi:hypothetical protein
MIITDEAVEKLSTKDKTDHILLNRIRCPDGTILTSWYRHDYVTHVDENGFEYMVDGGTSYLRRNIVEDHPYEELSVYWSEDHSANRELVTWGTYGKNGDQPFKRVFLKDMSTNHIHAVIDECLHGGILQELFETEIDYRGEHGII